MEGESPSPIFIVGAPRSGTTLLRVMLNRHPNVGLCNETYFFYYIYTRRRAFGDLANPENRKRVVERYLETHLVSRLDLDLVDLKETLLREATDYRTLFLTLMSSYSYGHGKTRYGEKTPQHTLHIDTLRQLYPDCKIIHLVRDPRDVVASLLRMPWGARSASANARLWRNYVRAAEGHRHEENFLRVYYEKLVQEPETELHRICDLLGEPFSTQMLEADPTVSVDRWWFQRAQGPLDRDRSGKWRDELQSDQTALVEWVARPEMEALGYTPLGQKASLPARVVALTNEAQCLARNRLGKLPHLWYYWLHPTQIAAEEARIDKASGLRHNPPHARVAPGTEA